MKTKKISTLYTAMASMAVFGSGAFNTRFSYENGVELLATVLMSAISALVLFISLKCVTSFKNKLVKINAQKHFTPVFFLLSAVCLLSALYSLANLVLVLANTVADKTGVGIIILALIIIVGMLTYYRRSVLLKFSGLCFVLCFALVILIFIFSYKYMSVKYLAINTFPSVNKLSARTAKLFVLEFLPVLLPIIVLFLNKHSSAMLGLGIGFGMLILTVANTILIFSLPFASGLSYPYLKAVDTVSIGENFFRMSAAVYPIALFPGVIRVAIQLAASAELFFKAKKIRKI